MLLRLRGNTQCCLNVAYMHQMFTLRAEVNRVYSDCQSQFLVKVFTACVVKRTPMINQEIFLRCLGEEKKRGRGARSFKLQFSNQFSQGKIFHAVGIRGGVNPIAPLTPSGRES